jgi:predicted nucleotidyltransferase
MTSPDLERLEQHLASNPRLRQAIVFGSMATGTARADSDLDLAVDIGCPLTSEDRLALITDLSSFCGRPVDLVDLRTVGEPLLGQILQNGQRLLGTHADFGDLIARHFTDSADFLPLRRRIQDERRRAWIGM